jgi:hypothetical protein
MRSTEKSVHDGGGKRLGRKREGSGKRSGGWEKGSGSAAGGNSFLGKAAGGDLGRGSIAADLRRGSMTTRPCLVVLVALAGGTDWLFVRRALE